MMLVVGQRKFDFIKLFWFLSYPGDRDAQRMDSNQIFWELNYPPNEIIKQINRARTRVFLLKDVPQNRTKELYWFSRFSSWFSVLLVLPLISSIIYPLLIIYNPFLTMTLHFLWHWAANHLYGDLCHHFQKCLFGFPVGETVQILLTIITGHKFEFKA